MIRIAANGGLLLLVLGCATRPETMRSSSQPSAPPTPQTAPTSTALGPDDALAFLQDEARLFERCAALDCSAMAREIQAFDEAHREVVGELHRQAALRDAEEQRRFDARANEIEGDLIRTAGRIGRARAACEPCAHDAAFAKAMAAHQSEW